MKLGVNKQAVSLFQHQKTQLFVPLCLGLSESIYLKGFANDVGATIKTNMQLCSVVRADKDFVVTVSGARWQTQDIELVSDLIR